MRPLKGMTKREVKSFRIEPRFYDKLKEMTDYCKSKNMAYNSESDLIERAIDILYFKYAIDNDNFLWT